MGGSVYQLSSGLNVESKRPITGDAFADVEYTRTSIEFLPFNIFVQKTATITTAEFKVFGDLQIEVYMVSHVLDISAFTKTDVDLTFTLEIGTIMQYPFRIKPDSNGGYEFTVTGLT